MNPAEALRSKLHNVLKTDRADLIMKSMSASVYFFLHKCYIGEKKDLPG